jgi:hypothetical protein
MRDTLWGETWYLSAACFNVPYAGTILLSTFLLYVKMNKIRLLMVSDGIMLCLRLFRTTRTGVQGGSMLLWLERKCAKRQKKRRKPDY